MYKLDFQQNAQTTTKQNSQKLRQKEFREQQDNKSRQQKQNDSKHMNAIRPYVTKQRKNSKQQIKVKGSTSEISRSRSKRLQSTTSNRKSGQAQQNSMISCENLALFNGMSQSGSKQKQINVIYHEMITLKAQYKSLKNSYNFLVKEKEQATSRVECEKLSHEREKLLLLSQLEKAKKNGCFLQSQIERIKRQCFRIIESEKFKYKKLQETLQEKELMTAYLRKEIEALKKVLVSSNKDQLNSSVVNQDNLEKIFFLQNSAPIFSYESYARLSANTSSISHLAGNVLIEEHSSNDSSSTPRPSKQGKIQIKHKKKSSQFQQDSLSFSRDKSKQFDSVHSLLSNYGHNHRKKDNYDNDNQQEDEDEENHTILTFTKKDIVVLDDSLSLDDSENNEFVEGEEKDQCPTFENRKRQTKELVSFQSLKAKRQLSKSNSHRSEQRKSKSRQQIKRLEILTDNCNEQFEKRNEEEQNSCDTKKKFSSKSKIKNKKNSKSQGLHSSMMTEVFHNSFVKKDSQGNVSQGKSMQVKRK